MGLSAGRAEGVPGTPVTFEALPGFASDDHRAALQAFRVTCAPILADASPLRLALSAPEPLRRACRTALALSSSTDAPAARRFFETNFTPRRLDEGFLTGYYEPVVDGSLTRTEAFTAPLLGRPSDLVGVAPGQASPGLDPGLTAARRLADGTLQPYPDRAAIEAGALGTLAQPLVYVGDPVEAFFIHVQGSARIRLPDGSSRRLAYAGRNGQPYTSIGRVLVEQAGIPPAEMGLAQLKSWIRAHGQKPGEEGAALMARNRSFIFFAFNDALPPEAGPVGGAGVSLTPLRSLAVDRTLWPYGLPVYLDASLPWQGEAATPFQRLMVAQDTGSAIRGAARGDIFFGSGAQAAQRAGALRHPGTFFILWPKGEAEVEGAKP